MSRNQPIRISAQDGAVLVVSLIMLLLLTIIGVTAMRTVTLEERMAGNLRDRNIANQAAESSLRFGADWLLTQTTRPTPDAAGTNGVWGLEDAGNLDDPTFDWTTAGFEYGTRPGMADAEDLSLVAREPRYVIEERYFFPDDSSPESLAKGNGWYYYQVTGGGFGGSDNTRAVLQATIAQRYN